MRAYRQVAVVLLFSCSFLTLIWLSTTRASSLASSLLFSYVEILSSASPAVVNVGEPLTFTVRISNSSEAQLNDLVIVDHIPHSHFEEVAEPAFGGICPGEIASHQAKHYILGQFISIFTLPNDGTNVLANG